MASICLYFQLHQPPRLRRYRMFNTGARYFDQASNRDILQKVADRCYRPALTMLSQMVRRHEGRFRLAFSITGSLLDQLHRDAPDVVEQLRALSDTGHVEFLAETYHHSLASLYSDPEWTAQVQQQRETIERLFDHRPMIFRNTELIYSDALVSQVAGLGGFKGILAEGTDRVLNGRSPDHVYRSAGDESLPLLLRNYQLSDDIAFRFMNHQGTGRPLTAATFADAVDQRAPDGELVNLFMDMEAIGEHQGEETGIFSFLDAMPGELLHRGHTFRTPGECIDVFQPIDTFDAPFVTSWADTERDLSAWRGNAMQSSALTELYSLEQPVKATGDPTILSDWRMLTTSDHFYYMCTKSFDDQAVHHYFNPYESPYDAYINFMNVLDDLRMRLGVVVP